MDRSYRFDGRDFLHLLGWLSICFCTKPLSQIDYSLRFSAFFSEA